MPLRDCEASASWSTLRTSWSKTLPSCVSSLTMIAAPYGAFAGGALTQIGLFFVQRTGACLPSSYEGDFNVAILHPPAGRSRSAMPMASACRRAASYSSPARLAGMPISISKAKNSFRNSSRRSKTSSPFSRSRRQAEPHLPANRILHRQARLSRGPARTRAHLEIADRKPFPRDEHDFCRRSARYAGKDRTGSNRRYSRVIDAWRAQAMCSAKSFAVRRRASAAAATRR